MACCPPRDTGQDLAEVGEIARAGVTQSISFRLFCGADGTVRDEPAEV